MTTWRKSCPGSKRSSPGPPCNRSGFIAAGFGLEPVAVEPLVTDPVSVCYDADGRLYVVEMRGYPFPEKNPSGNVTRLEDRDGDGRFETRTIFLDGLSWPTGIIPYDDGVFIAVAPEIIYAKDTNGDGVADVKKVMFTGFGTDNVQGLLNGLLWGPDGWIYGVTSSNGGTIHNASRPDAKPVSVRGRDFRYKPDGSAFEAISGGGQFGHCFDDWGHRFTCNNSNHIRQIVLPSYYLERNRALIAPPAIPDITADAGPASSRASQEPPLEPWRVVFARGNGRLIRCCRRLPPTELFATGFFTSATGVTVYRGSAYPPEYRGNLFVGDVGGNLVHRKFFSVAGANFIASRADANVEFLTSTDNWFRPVNFANTPDGTLLILDMYRETIEHPFSIPEPIKKHLDLTSGKDRGRLYDLVYRTAMPATPKLGHAPTAERVGLLGDPDCWWRETAQRLLFERQDRSAVGPLNAMVKERKSALGRLHALWSLDLLGALEPAAISLGLEDPEPRVREQAIRLAEAWPGREPALFDEAGGFDGRPRPDGPVSTRLFLGRGQRRSACNRLRLASIDLDGCEQPMDSMPPCRRSRSPGVRCTSCACCPNNRLSSTSPGSRRSSDGGPGGPRGIRAGSGPGSRSSRTSEHRQAGFASNDACGRWHWSWGMASGVGRIGPRSTHREDLGSHGIAPRPKRRKVAGTDGHVQDRVVAIRLVGMADAKTCACVAPQATRRTASRGRSTRRLADPWGGLGSRSCRVTSSGH